MQQDRKNTSVFKYAADKGVYMGLYLTALSACLLLANTLPFSPMLAIPLTIGLPFFAGWLMNNIAKAQPEYRAFTPMWVAGIYIFIFGTLICALLSGLYLVFIEPNFLITYFTNSLKTLAEAGVSSSIADTSAISEALQKGSLPSPMQFVISMSWSSCFFGSMISIPLAMIVARAGKPRNLNR